MMNPKTVSEKVSECVSGNSHSPTYRLTHSLLCLLLLVGCASPQPGDTIRRSVQARVVYELRTAPNRNSPSIESYLEHAALSIRKTAAGDNLTPDYVKNQIGRSEARQHWSVQAELALDDALRFYEREYRRANPSNRANLLAVADGINLARQTR